MRNEKFRKVIALFALAAASAGSAAPRQGVNLVWSIAPAENADLTEHTVKDGEIVLRQKLVPLGLAILGGDVIEPSGNKLVAKRGGQLVEAGFADGRAFCALDTVRIDKSGVEVPNNRGVTLCFVDRERDGRFDMTFEAAGAGGGTGVIIQGTLPKTPQIVDMPYEEHPVSELRGDFWVGIRYEQYFNIYGNRMLMTDIGGRGVTMPLTSFATFKSKGVYPQKVSVLGANITLIAPEEKGTRLRVENAMPTQPFALYTYTTTTFIPIYR